MKFKKLFIVLLLSLLFYGNAHAQAMFRPCDKEGDCLDINSDGTVTTTGGGNFSNYISVDSGESLSTAVSNAPTNSYVKAQPFSTFTCDPISITNKSITLDLTDVTLTCSTGTPGYLITITNIASTDVVRIIKGKYRGTKVTGAVLSNMQATTVISNENLILEDPDIYLNPDTDLTQYRPIHLQDSGATIIRPHIVFTGTGDQGVWNIFHEIYPTAEASTMVKVYDPYIYSTAEATNPSYKFNRGVDHYVKTGVTTSHYMYTFGGSIYNSGGSGEACKNTNDILNTQRVITGITQANPAVVTTSVAHGYTDGTIVVLRNVTGMTQINDLEFTVANASGSTFELQGIDSSAYTVYAAGGTSDRAVYSNFYNYGTNCYGTTYSVRDGSYQGGIARFYFANAGGGQGNYGLQTQSVWNNGMTISKGLYLKNTIAKGANASVGIAAEAAITLRGQVGGLVTDTGTRTGGAGAGVDSILGAGGICSRASTCTGGTGGDYTWKGGPGGSPSLGTGTNTGGRGGFNKILGGDGGSSTNGSSNTGGRGGHNYFSGGSPGTGATANGSYGTNFIGYFDGTTPQGYTVLNYTPITIAADVTAPDVRYSSYHITSANTGATALTTLTNATAGQTVCIIGGSATNSTTIADAGNFNLTAAMTLGLDDNICLYAKTASSFIEISRSNN